MKIIVGVTGASGVEMSYYLVKALKNIEGCQVHLILTEGAKKTWKLESDIPLIDLVLLADVVHEDENLAAVISSGSYVTEGMIVMPCSMKTLAGITAGYAENLLVESCGCVSERRQESGIGTARNAAWKSTSEKYERGSRIGMCDHSAGSYLL